MLKVQIKTDVFNENTVFWAPERKLIHMYV